MAGAEYITALQNHSGTGVSPVSSSGNPGQMPVPGRAQKILALQFKYLGDAVFLTPALRAMREHWPNSQLHVLLPEDAAPLLENVPWLTKVWTMPRTRGHARLRDSWPVIRSLRRERFDRSVDFAGNDRGAIVSWLCGAPERLGPFEGPGFWGRKRCYTVTVPGASLPVTYVDRNLQILAAWQIPPPKSPHLEIAANPELAGPAAQILPANAILCHVASSNPKKEWPLLSWLDLHRLAARAGRELFFSAGISARERALLDGLKRLEPSLRVLPPVPDLRLFLAVLKRAALMIAGDTGPLHFAAALGVPVIGLFGVKDSVLRASPIYRNHKMLTGGPCTCHYDTALCEAAQPCMAAISPDDVFGALLAVLESQTPPALQGNPGQPP